MGSKRRNGSGSARSRVATVEDLRQVLKRTEAFQEQHIRGRAASNASSISPQSPQFLKDIPPLGTLYEPKQPATKKLRKIIEENYYSASFESAIKTVSLQRVPELDKIHTLYQFYYFIDEMVTWIPELRVWDWNGETLHERTDYLRITQFYYYFNQPELEALQSPVAPKEGEILSPVSLWLREFALEWGAFLDKTESSRYLESYKYGPEYAWQDYQKEPQEYKTFNEWFARQFKNIEEQRPVAQPDNDRVIVFPAESTFVIEPGALRCLSADQSGNPALLFR